MQYLSRRYFWKSKVAWSAWIAPNALIDRTWPLGVIIEENVWIGPFVVVLTHDMTRGRYQTTRIGHDSVIGARAVIMPGVTIGNGAIVEPGSVVSNDVDAGAHVSGNPARTVRKVAASA